MGLPEGLSTAAATSPMVRLQGLFYSGADKKIIEELAEAMIDPKRAAVLMQNPAIQKTVQRGLLSAPGRAALMSPGIAAAGLVANQ
jgi:hypothetical protein